MKTILKCVALVIVIVVTAKALSFYEREFSRGQGQEEARTQQRPIWGVSGRESRRERNERRWREFDSREADRVTLLEAQRRRIER